jgi:molybdenum cofactor cytidylyltransferase
MISAVVLAAGLSSRMGRFKLLLPWQGGTVIGRVVRTLEEAGLEEIVVVTGHRAGEVTAALAGTRARTVLNPDYAAGEMLSSVQVGLRALGPDADAALLCLGDQPQMEAGVVRAVLAAGDGKSVVIPSYRMHAGHPILLPRTVWPDALAASGTLKEALAPHRAGFTYVVVDAPSVLADLDTPEDYERAAMTGVEPSGGSSDACRQTG